MSRPTAKQRLAKALKRGQVPEHLRDEVRELLAAPNLREEVLQVFEDAQIRSYESHMVPNIEHDDPKKRGKLLRKRAMPNLWKPK